MFNTSWMFPTIANWTGMGRGSDWGGLEAFALQSLGWWWESCILCPWRSWGSSLDITQGRDLALLLPGVIHQSSLPSENDWKIWTKHYKCLHGGEADLDRIGVLPLGTRFSVCSGPGNVVCCCRDGWNSKSPEESCLFLLYCFSPSILSRATPIRFLSLLQFL